MTFAVKPFSLYSSARVSTKLSCADFAAVYSAVFAEGCTVSGLVYDDDPSPIALCDLRDKCLKQMECRPHVSINHGFEFIFG